MEINKDNMNIKECEHIWKEKERQRFVDKFIPNGLFSDGVITYKFKIMQVCEKCGKYNVVIF